MQLKATILTALLASTASAAVAGAKAKVFKCGTKEPSAEHIKISQNLAAQEKEFAASGNLSIAATIAVDVYFHVVASSTAVADGYVTDTQLANQLTAMNNAYAPYGISFTLKGTDRTINSVWASDGNELAMKKALRKGTYRSLNIYFIKDLGDNLGYCYFPTTVTTGSNNFYLDGCSVLAASVPGGSATNYNLGYTSVHESGHWFGLYHTFQGGCTGSGDSVSDTPAQASASSGCPTGRDSCPNASGLDPIHNYMDYSYDSCYTEFTAGQKTRMYSYWNSYRAGK